MNMNNQTTGFNPQELCSRKLWQLVKTPTDAQVSERELQEAIAELAARRHYLAELEQMGKLGGDAKEAWDNIDLSGFADIPMQMKVNFLCQDSALAAPLPARSTTDLSPAATVPAQPRGYSRAPGRPL